VRSRVTALDPDMKIIVCCSFCGYESRTTRAWKHSHAKFQCAGCGETISLLTKTPRTALDALAFGLNDFWRRLSFRASAC
jgi:transposase-like protein